MSFPDILSYDTGELVYEKQKYAQKALTDQTVDTTLKTLLDVYDWSSFDVDFLTLDSLLSSLTSTILFDIPLSDLTPWNRVWETELPTTEEFIRGVTIKFEPVKIEDVFPWVTDIESTIREIFQPPYAENLVQSRLTKGIYGYSRYGQAYYDPQAVREFLRSTMWKMGRRPRGLMGLKADYESIANALGLNPAIVEFVFERLNFMEAIKTEDCTWDYCWWDVSRWGPEHTVKHSPEQIVSEITFMNWELKPITLEYYQVIDAQACTYWDNGWWDLTVWCPIEPVYTLVLEKLKPKILELADFIIYGFRRRFFATALAMINYMTVDERSRPLTSFRLELWAFARSTIQFLERVVDNVVSRLRPEAPSFIRRLYKTAVNELYRIMWSRHKWGQEAYRAMTIDELKQYWIERWVRYGLDKDVLNELWNRVTPLVVQLGSEKDKMKLKDMQYRFLKY